MISEGRVIVITGASGGVGGALARRLAAPGRHLVLCGRDQEKLQRVAADALRRGATTAVRRQDLSQVDGARALAAAILAEDGVPDVVISCAGHSLHRSFEDTLDRPDDLSRMTAVNLVGTAGLILALLRPMCSQGRGTIVAVTSATARIPAPGWAAYGASKAGLDSWLRALRPEAAAHGIRIAIVEMPLVATAMSRPLYGSRPRGALSPEQAAGRVLQALRPGRTLITPPWARLGAPLSQLAPHLTARFLSPGHQSTLRRLLRRP